MESFKEENKWLEEIHSLQTNTVNIFLYSFPAHFYYAWKGEEGMKVLSPSKNVLCFILQK